MKKAIAALLSVLVLLAFSPTALATNYEQEFVQETPISRYADISLISPTLTVSGGTASYSLYVSGKANVTSISATLQIQILNPSGSYANYGASWSASSQTGYLHTSGTKTVASGSTYRLKVTVTAYTSTGSSTETAYS